MSRVCVISMSTSYVLQFLMIIIFPSNFSDIDECAIETDACDENADCTNTIGSYTCTCRSGYSGNGIVCQG